MKISSKMFFNVISLIAINAVCYGQADSMQPIQSLKKTTYAQLGINRHYGTDYNASLWDNKILKYENLSKELDLCIAKNTTAIPEDYVGIKLHKCAIHPVRPRNFVYLKINANIDRHLVLFKELLKSAKEGKTCGGLRIRHLNERIMNNHGEFKDLVRTIIESHQRLPSTRSEVVENAGKMYTNSYDLLGMINSQSKSITNVSNIE